MPVDWRECNHQFPNDKMDTPCIWCNMTYGDYTLVPQGQLTLF